MNVAAPTPARPPAGRTDAGPLASHGRSAMSADALATADGQRHADDFAELLQRKSQRSDEPVESVTSLESLEALESPQPLRPLERLGRFDRLHRLGPDEPADAAPAYAALPAPALVRVDAAPLAPRAPVDVRAPEALQPALRALQHAAAVDAPASPMSQAVSHAAWEVTIQTPGGVPLQLKVARAAEPPLPLQPVPGGWTLTLTAPARETAALNRHAPRLNERLRERSLSSEPVRIEAEEDGDLP